MDSTHREAPFIWPEKIQSARSHNLPNMLTKMLRSRCSRLTIPNSVARGGSERCRRFRIISENNAYKIRKKVRVTYVT
jgi:hypothetical protein